MEAFSQASAVAKSQRPCWAGRTCSIARLTRSGAECSTIGTQTVKVMKTLHEQTSQSGADEWTCSLAAFRASLSVTPGDEEARKMTAISGRQCIAPSMKSSPLGLWLKTLLESSRWSSRARFLRWQAQPIFSTRLTTFEDDTNCERPLPCNASAQTLKVTDMPSSRCLFRLVPSEPPTDETGCSSSQGEKRNLLLPTPLVVEREHPDRVENLKAAGATRINSRVNGEQRPNGLIDFMQFYDLLPTPLTWDGAGGGARNLNKEGRTDTPWEYSATLKDLAKSDLLPTPTAIEGVKWTNTWNPNSQMGQSLSAMAGSGMLPTPLTGEYRDAAITENNAMKGLQDNLSRIVSRLALGINKDGSPMDGVEPSIKSEKGGQTSRLSPLFTEEMMGFPLMWTALPFLSESGAPKPSKPTATPSSPK